MADRTVIDEQTNKQMDDEWATALYVTCSVSLVNR